MNEKYLIVGKYSNKPYEIIDSSPSHPSAIKLMKEYQLAFGNEWILDVRYNSNN